MRPVWIITWFDPPKEREAAQALLDAGADVIARESDSPEPDKVAQEGRLRHRLQRHQAEVAPNAVLTAPIWNWDVYYKQAVEDAARTAPGRRTPIWWGMNEGIAGPGALRRDGAADVQDEVNAEKARIISGEFDVFGGPIKDNTGKERVKAGETMTDEQMLAFDWLVEGVTGEIPK